LGAAEPAKRCCVEIAPHSDDHVVGQRIVTALPLSEAPGLQRRVRYLVLPERPAGTEGAGEEELAARVTRNAMIGVQRL